MLKYKNIVKRKCNLTSRQNIQPQGLIDYPCMLLPIHIQTIGYHRNYCGRWLTQPLCPPLWYFLTYLCVTLHRGRHLFLPLLASSPIWLNYQCIYLFKKYNAHHPNTVSFLLSHQLFLSQNPHLPYLWWPKVKLDSITVGSLILSGL